MRHNVVAYLALFVALGGTSAYAANTVFSADIVDGEVKSVDVGDGEIKSADVKDQSLTTFDVSTFLGADVVDNTLTGDDIDESTLNLTPEAVHLVPASGTNGFANAWGNDDDPTTASPAGYWKDLAGTVHLRGTVSALGSGAMERILTLPVGYRPSAPEIFPVATVSATAGAQVLVRANGSVEAYSGTNQGISFAGIQFRP
jgi:hypothetical protein